jgi:hypothetical protein
VLSGAPRAAPVTASQRVTVGPEVERRHVFVIRTVTLGRETAPGRAAAHGRRWLVPVAGVLGAALAHSERVNPEVIAPEVIVTVAIGPILEITVLGPVIPVHRGRRGRRGQRGLGALWGLWGLWG